MSVGCASLAVGRRLFCRPLSLVGLRLLLCLLLAGLAGPDEYPSRSSSATPLLPSSSSSLSSLSLSSSASLSLTLVLPKSGKDGLSGGRAGPRLLAVPELVRVASPPPSVPMSRSESLLTTTVPLLLSLFACLVSTTAVEGGGAGVGEQVRFLRAGLAAVVGWGAVGGLLVGVAASLSM